MQNKNKNKNKIQWQIYAKLWDIPTTPKRTQYTAAKIVNGIDANSAPNFPSKIHTFHQ